MLQRQLNTFAPYETFDFPPVRDIFIPEKGKVIIDIDEEGADARVVAWRIQSQRMKDAFNAGKKIHAENAKLMFPVEECGVDGKKEPRYTQTKKCVHATNYGVTAPTMSKYTGFPLMECTNFIRRWMRNNPEVPQWHEEVEFLCQRDRGITNPFGYSIRWFDRPYALRNKALAWEPQSVVAEVSYRVLRQARKHAPELEPLMQVHDSLVFQSPIKTLRKNLQILHSIWKSIEVPYRDPLVIPWGLKISTDAWGKAKERKWSDYL
jgi:DNA polymerase I